MLGSTLRDWRHASALGLLLGLPAFLYLESAYWSLAGLALFAALGWAGYRAEPVLEQKPPPPPTEPRRLQDGPFSMVELPGGTFLMGSAAGDSRAHSVLLPQALGSPSSAAAPAVSAS